MSTPPKHACLHGRMVSGLVEDCSYCNLAPLPRQGAEQVLADQKSDKRFFEMAAEA